MAEKAKVVLTADERKDVLKKALAKAQKKNAKVKGLKPADQKEVLARALKRKQRDADRATTVPKFADASGALVLTKLKGSDFPGTREGKLAYCDYQVLKWQDKKLSIAAKDDPVEKKRKKIADLKKKIALLEKEVGTDDDETEKE